jgi:hypothetical protein
VRHPTARIATVARVARRPRDTSMEHAPSDASPFRTALEVGVVVAPRLLRDVGQGLAAELTEQLQVRYPSARWHATVQVDPLVVPPATDAELVAEARKVLLAGRWDMALVVTDLPLRQHGRPVPHRTSRTHRVAVVSLPALGTLHVRRRLGRLLLRLVSELIGGGDERRALHRLSRRVGELPAGLSLLFVPAVLFGHLRLLAGMVRANRPWRLAARLYGALIAAFAAGAYGIVTSDIWRLSASMGWVRLTLTSAASVSATVLAVVVAHELWESTPDPSVRGQVALFNLATLGTVFVGIVTLYLALFALILAGAALVITPSQLSHALGRDSGIGDYGTLAWFVASLATVGGALGAGLESDDAVREAAYAGGSRVGANGNTTGDISAQ